METAIAWLTLIAAMIAAVSGPAAAVWERHRVEGAEQRVWTRDVMERLFRAARELDMATGAVVSPAPGPTRDPEAARDRYLEARGAFHSALLDAETRAPEPIRRLAARYANSTLSVVNEPSREYIDECLRAKAELDQAIRQALGTD